MTIVITYVITPVITLRREVLEKLRIRPWKRGMAEDLDAAESLGKQFKLLTHDDYPEPRPVKVRGTYVVEVSIPRPIRPLMALFGKGKGKAPNRRKVAGKTLDDYEKKKRSLTALIYSEFDEIQNKLHTTINQTKRQPWHHSDFFTEGIVMTMMDTYPNVLPKGNSSFSHTTEDGDLYIENLTSQMDFEELVRLRFKIDAMAELVRNAEPTEKEKKEWKEKNNDDPYPFQYDVNIRGSVAEYMQPETRSWWEDLLVTAAKEQNKAQPQFDDPTEDDFWLEVEEGDELGVFKRRTNPPSKPLDLKNERPRITSPNTMASLLDEFEAHIRTKNYAKKNQKKSADKVMVGVKEFIELMGDFDPRTLDPTHASEFVTVQLEKDPERSKKSLNNRNWAMNTFSRWCVSKRITKSYPFYGHKLEKWQGRPTQSWLEYIDKDLDIIFDYEWKNQERLLISLALATGMRINEIACLTWERIINLNTFQYISLLPEGQEQFSIKNEGSKRLIPIHPDIKLPERSKGRVFNYTIDQFGHATSSAGHAVNPIIDELVEHDRKSFHSFRSTFKIKLRATGCPTDVNKQITGHGSGDVSTDVYDGVTVEDRYDYISKLELPWLRKGDLKWH